jgi:hypothetical protein
VSEFFEVALALLTVKSSGSKDSRKWLSRLAGQFTMFSMLKNGAISVEDEKFALYWVTHSNRPGVAIRSAPRPYFDAPSTGHEPKIDLVSGSG